MTKNVRISTYRLLPVNPGGRNGGGRMNRINRYHKRATTNFLLCKKIYLNSWDPITELMCQKAHGEARIWSAIRATIRNGYKKESE